ncbi:XrtA/PEP-CTERM system histidine kinase PrsK [Rheinheimera nanhaiensis]|uniref:histidine kinase n=1 Tax=Rheinheimera nanhaiensis E407-8 TaxID=562729 RepID=I1DTY2_9GAMM|nr:XrtA/PEP-CTERM system histidine kinase PrsK [Rheinheimera nanhaiensis]GAB57510.1 sensor signal transduction histidine kinase [Rheinheimera nanhaiensis E407-8]
MDLLTQLAVDKIGFMLAALAYFVFFLLILVTRVKNLPRLLLLSWALGGLAWALYYSLNQIVPYSTLTSLGLELGRSYLLLLFLLSALSAKSQSLPQFFSSRTVWLLSLTLLLWFMLCTSSWLTANLIFTGSLVLGVLQLALLEAMYRKAAGNRWQYKPLILSLSVPLLFDFVLLAESALFGQVDNQLWAARGYVYTAMIPIAIVAVRRIQAWGISVYVSRDIVLQSSLVLASGLYLCLISIVGFYLRYVGGTWSNLLQTTFLALGFAMLALMLFSGTVRRHFRVFIEKHFFANKFDYRQKWLELTRHLRQVDLSSAEQYDTLLQAWLNAIGYSRGCLVRLSHTTPARLLSCSGRSSLSVDEMTLINRYAARYAQQHWLVDLSDPKDPFASAQQDLASVDIQLILPIHSEGELWGLCLMNAPEVDKQKLNWELRDYLMLVTEQISSYLMLMQASKTLSENAQFAAFSRMSAFVVHDLKNVKAQIDLILTNSQRHKDNPEFIADTFDTLAAMQQRLGHMLDQLSNKRTTTSMASTFSVRNLIEQVITQRCAAKQPLPLLIAEQDVQLSIDKERLASVLYHLIDNAQHATANDGTITVRLTLGQSNLCISISDTGCGMSEQFIQQRLFKPFDSTKGNSGMGVGAYDALHFAQQHQGQLLVKSEQGVGTTFSLMLPLN